MECLALSDRQGTPEQLADSLAAAELPPLGPEVLVRLDELVPPGTHVSDFHNSSRWMGGQARRP